MNSILIAALCLVAQASAVRLPEALKAADVQPKIEILDRKPKFCHGLDCPRYDVIRTYAKGIIELRAYRSAVWVSTKIKGSGYDSASRNGAKVLAKYIDGGNEDKTKFDAAVPITVRASPGKYGPYTDGDYVVSFLLPFKHKRHAPLPKDKDVYLEAAPSADYYVFTFDKWIDEYSLMTNVKTLTDGLTNLDLDFDDSYFYSAVYDAPEEWQERHNEIWVKALGSKRKADDEATTKH